MINWETIKSLYNDKPTLMEWLKKVEAALSGATLTSVSVNTISVGVISLTFEFDDGTSTTTPNINLPQGAQGVSITGASIVAGKLILTLSNGTTIDAGNTGAVLGFEIDNSQHLIVKYQDGTSEDLGAIFTGNVNITGDLSVGGNISPLESIVDTQARKRFIEGTLAIPSSYTGSGLTLTYARWSLSGTHLMVVVAGTLEAGNSLTSTFAVGFIPAWIYNKIVEVFFNKVSVQKGVFADNYGTLDLDASFMLAKSGGNLLVEKVGTHTAATHDENFRVQFDLLIDGQ